MKKTMMALAVGAAFAAPAAHADVTLSGAINMGIEYVDVGSGTNTTVTNGIRAGSGGVSEGTFGVATNYSNITITSVDDLGGGLKLDFAFQLVAPTASNSDVANRNSHIGLVSESWGGVWYGSNENIYERYFYSIDPLDGAQGLGGNLQIMGNPGAGSVFSAQTGAPQGNNGSATFYRRDEQAIWYDSPNFSGFTFGAAIGTTFAKDANGLKQDPWMWQLGVKYVGTSFPLQAWGAYVNHKDYFGLNDITGNTNTVNAANTNAGLDSNDRAMQLGVGYTLGDIFIFANYEMLKYKNNGVTTTGGGGANPVTEYSRDAWGIGMKWNLASGYIGAQYISALDGDAKCLVTGCTANDTGASMIGLGYYHTMSKQTQVYVLGSWLGNDDLANYQTAGTGNAASGVNVGADYTGIGVGIKHSF